MFSPFNLLKMALRQLQTQHNILTIQNHNKRYSLIGELK